MLHINSDFTQNQVLFGRILQALNLLYSGKCDELPVGRYDFEDGMYYMVQAYDTKDFNGEYEAHQNFVDIQYVISGKEQIRMFPTKDLVITRPYNPDKDVLFGTGEGTDTVFLKDHDAVVLMPDEGHAPQLTACEKCAVKKVVVKIPVK